MNVVERTQNSIDSIRCPAIRGLDKDTVHMLHISLVQIVQMRRSIERAELQIRRSSRAAYESVELLRRLYERGF
jgi:phosphoribosylcarboxyaminoimidazole (NCAIR) mutase